MGGSAWQLGVAVGGAAEVHAAFGSALSVHVAGCDVLALGYTLMLYVIGRFIFIAWANNKKWAIRPCNVSLHPAHIQSSFKTLILKVVREEKIDREGQQCNPNPNYGFTRCVRQKLSQTTGCRLPWDLTTQGMCPKCFHQITMTS
jgi:hypothetical protein